MINQEKKRFAINILANIIVFSINLLINFCLVPFMSKTLGDESVGFINLATNFVNYTTIITAALNGMAGRFISVSYHKEEFEKANKYFTSVLFANCIISAFLFLIMIFFVNYINYFLNIPIGLESDIKLTFVLVFINSFVLLIDTVYNLATFIKNKLDVAAIKIIFGNAIKILLLLFMFCFFNAKMYYLASATLISSIFIVIIDIYLTQKYTPELKVKLKWFQLKKVLEILKEGIWNSVAKLSEILLTGLDLLIVNMFIGPLEMGLLAIAKTIPQAIISLTSAVANAFSPKYTLEYSKGNKEKLVKLFGESIKVETILIAVPMIGFIFFSLDFYKLWLPNKTFEELRTIQILSILTLLPSLINGLEEGLYFANILTKQIKKSVIVTLIIGVVSTIFVFICLKFTNMGIYAVAGVSSIMMLLRALLFTPVYCSYVLKIKLNHFYPELFKSIGVIIILSITFYLCSLVINITGWLSFIINISIVGVIGYIEVFIYYFIISKIKKVYYI